MPSGKLSVIMPAFNEAEGVTRHLRSTIAALQALGFDFEIVLVDDGSNDQTCAAACTLLTEFPSIIRIVRYERNRGKGHALFCGVQQASGEYIAFLDADGELQAAQLPEFFRVLEQQHADIVVGSKLHRRSHVSNYPFRRRIWSLGYYGIVRTLFGLPVKDTQTGLKLFRSVVLHRVLPKVLVKRFAFDVEILAVARHFGFKMAEAPVRVEFLRSFSRVNLRDAYAVFVDTLAIFYRLHLLHYYDHVTAEWPTHERPVEVITADSIRLGAALGDVPLPYPRQKDLASSG